ncbi:MAG: aminotransferase class IV [Acidimicrobiia bacterium]|nr:aminotransferase class IV [Acidimicrobiia bacterium]
MRVLIDGKEVDPVTASISVFDWGVVRGDGCFEALRSYDGVAFAVDAHLDRLMNSAAVLGMGTMLPDRSLIADWVETAAADGGDCVVRVIATRGGTDVHIDAPPRLIVFWEELPLLPSSITLVEISAPWHSGGFPWKLAGVKGLSYGPNMASVRMAKSAGFDDALLVSREGIMLEGPTNSVGWVVDGVVETPSLDLGILSSITRTVTLEVAADLGIKVRQGRFPTERLDRAQEFFVLSTVKEVTSVSRVGERRFAGGPVTRALGAAFRERVLAATHSI